MKEHRDMESAARPDGTSLEGISVLIVDDDAEIAHLTRSALVHVQAQVEVAPNGYQGLHALLFRDIDVAVVDVRMPVMDGVEFISEARRICPWLGFIILSGFVDHALLESARALGVEVMEKPFDPPALTSLVKRKALEKQSRLERPANFSIDRRQREQMILQTMTMSAVHSETLEDALRDLCLAMGEILPVSVAGMLQLGTESKLSFEIQEPVAESFLMEMQDDIRRRYQLMNNGRQLPDRIQVVAHGMGTDPSGAAHIGTCHTIPVIVGPELTGLLAFAARAESAYSDIDVSFLYHAANHLSAVIADFQRTRRQATTDSLTGLFNRHYLKEQLTHLQQLAKRYSFSVGVAILDLDGLKVINDTYGHLAGDDVIREVGEIVGRTARASDTVARYGGDEFVVLLPETGPEEIVQFCGRVLEEVRRHVFCEGSLNLRVMVSMGAANMKVADGQVLSPSEFLARADQALYQVKMAGTGGFRVWSETDTQSRQDTEEHTYHHPDRTTAVATEAVLNALTRVLEARRPLNGEHWSRTRNIALAIGRQMNLRSDELRDLGYGAILHDIGKLAMPDAILKKETTLTEEEWAVLKTHPEAGYRILQPLPFLRSPADIVRHHQERYDGSGYPSGLKGDAISLGARIVAVADAYDAMRSKRPYRESMPMEAAITEIEVNKGIQFDPTVVDAFLSVVSQLEPESQ